jgi:hypothetical protein
MTQGRKPVGFNRRELATQAMAAWLNIRLTAGLDLETPICIYALCDANKVIVRFNEINMEGMYDRIPKPRIHLCTADVHGGLQLRREGPLSTRRSVPFDRKHGSQPNSTAGLKRIRSGVPRNSVPRPNRLGLAA